MSSPTTTSARAARTVVLICMVTILFDGYDLLMFGAIVPSLLAYQPWALSPAQVGAIGGYTLLGMMVGALTAGVVTDLVGRRRVLLTCVAFFSAAMAACALAPNPELLGLFRFLAGLGLGGVVPTAVALTAEYAPPGRRQTYNAVMFAGISAGGLMAALLALAVVPALGFRAMFWIGVAPLVLVLPLVYLYLPESTRYLASVGRTAEAAALAHRFGQEPPVSGPTDRRVGLRSVAKGLFGLGNTARTLLFAAASFCGLLLTHGLSTWLPTIMQRAGYGIGPSISFLLALNLGGIVGSIGLARLGDRIGPKYVVAGSFAAAALAILALAADMPAVVAYALVAMAGVGSVGAQTLLNGFVAVSYPDHVRGSALGWSLGTGRVGAVVGPVLGGVLLGSSLGLAWNFYVYVAVAALAVLAVLAVPRRHDVATVPLPAATIAAP